MILEMSLQIQFLFLFLRLIVHIFVNPDLPWINESPCLALARGAILDQLWTNIINFDKYLVKFDHTSEKVSFQNKSR